MITGIGTMKGDIAEKKILMVVAQKNFRDEEFFEPRDIFEDEGLSITVASNSTQEAEGMLGGSVMPDISIDDADMADFDAIVIAGGGGSREYLWKDQKLHEMVREAFEMEKVIAAICISPVVLAKAGILDGKRATVFADPASAMKFGKAVLDALGKY